MAEGTVQSTGARHVRIRAEGPTSISLQGGLGLVARALRWKAAAWRGSTSPPAPATSPPASGWWPWATSASNPAPWRLETHPTA